PLRADRYALFFTALLCAGSLLTVLLSVDYLREQPLPAGEYHALVLLSTSGMIFLAAANDLIVLFLALEIMSVAVYVLAGMLRREVRSTEAALKYFLLGAFATGFLLYGIAFFYAAAGSTRLDVIAQAVARDGLTAYTLLGIALLLVGFGFKVALIPFHVWTPDVYEGAPTAVTAFMAVGVKAAGVGFRHPVLGLSMAVFMLSLAGVPPTAGFAGKFYLFSAAVDAGQVGLAVIGVLNSLVSVYYYLGVLVAMYMTEGERAIVAPGARPCLVASILVAVAATLAIGVLPRWPMEFALLSFASLR